MDTPDDDPPLSSTANRLLVKVDEVLSQNLDDRRTRISLEEQSNKKHEFDKDIVKETTTRYPVEPIAIFTLSSTGIKKLLKEKIYLYRRARQRKNSTFSNVIPPHSLGVKFKNGFSYYTFPNNFFCFQRLILKTHSRIQKLIKKQEEES